MADISLFRSIIFALIILFSLPVLGICAYFEYEIVTYSNGLDDVITIFPPLGLSAGGLSVVSLLLFLSFGSMHTRAFTSRIWFEIIWLFLLWLLWAGSASFIVALALVYSLSLTDPLIISIEVFAWLNVLCTFIYYVTIFWYAVINAACGRRIWSTSVTDAANAATPDAIAHMTQPAYVVSTQYGSYPPNVPLNQPYNSYFQQVPAHASPPQPYSSHFQIPGQVPPAQFYNTYPQPGIIPQGVSNQQYNAYPSQVPLQATQNQYYSYPVTPGALQQPAGFAGQRTSMMEDNIAPPPQPNYNTYPAHDSRAPGTLPNTSPH